jgi:GAF domain-containing protein/HAMP domain-containing protein
MFHTFRWRIAIPFIGLILSGMFSLAIFMSGFLRQAGLDQPEISRLQTFLFLGALLVSAIFSLLAVIVAGRIAGPLTALTNTARQIAAGNWDLRVAVESKDETGWLARAINSLAENIRQHIDNLERRVIEGTLDLKRRVLDFQIASEVTREINLIHDEKNLLQQAAELIRSRLEYDHVGIYLIDDRRESAVLKAVSGPSGPATAVLIDEMTCIGAAAATGRPSYTTGGIASTASNAQNAGLVQPALPHPCLPETRSEAAFPLRSGEQVLGILDVQSFLENTFHQEDISILETIAGQLAVSLQNARLYGELQSSLQEISTLYQRFTLEGWSKRPVLGDRRQAASMMAVREVGTIGYQFDRFRISPANVELPAGVSDLLQAGRAVVLSPGSPTGELGNELLTHTGTASLLLVPLLMHNQVIGIIGLEDPDPHHPWPAEEVAMVEAVANQVALSLENARLLEETQLRSEQLRLLQEITSAAASHIDLQELLVDVSQRLLAGFDLFACWFLFIDPDGKTGVLTEYLEAGAVPAKGLWRRLQLVDDPYVMEVMHTQKPLVMVDAARSTDAWPRPDSGSFQELVTTYNGKALVVAPLLSLGKVIGLMGLDFPDFPAGPLPRPSNAVTGPFNDEDLRLIEQISLQIAGAIDVARLFDQTQQRAEQERTISEITTKVRASTNIDVIMQTAIKELADKLHLSTSMIQMRGGNPNQARNGEGAND